MNLEFIFSEIFLDFNTYNRSKKDGLYIFFSKSKYKYNLLNYLLDIIRYCDNEKMVYEFLIFCSKLDIDYTNNQINCFDYPFYIVYIFINIMLCMDDQDKLEEYSNSLENKPISNKLKKKTQSKIVPYKRKDSLPKIS
jgi:hypothetical protein